MNGLFQGKNGGNHMTVKELKDQLNEFDDNLEVVIGVRQVLGTNFANEIRGCVVECNVTASNGKDYRTVAITEGTTIGSVDYVQEKIIKNEFETIEECMEELRRMVSLRNKMCGSLYWNHHNDKCVEIANDLSQMGANKAEIEKILEVGYKKNF